MNSYLSFTSPVFYVFIAVALAVFHLAPIKYRPAFILAISYLYYLACAPAFFPLLVLMPLLTSWVVKAIGRTTDENTRRLLLLTGLTVPLGTLAAFKLAQGAWGAAFPLGLSYYAFKLSALVLENRTPDAKPPNYLQVLTYTAFLPQITSGPIQRPGDFFKQIDKIINFRPTGEQFEAGIKRILQGLIMKLVLGDKLGEFVGTVYKSPAAYDWSVVAVATLTSHLQLFADFAGYTSIAIGLAKLLGIDSPENFQSPFLARTIAEFWRRTHITLTSLITDYVFNPLAITTLQLGKLGLVLSLTASLVLVGIWHGITWTFAIFGLIHAAFMSVSSFTIRARDRLFREQPTWVKTMRTAFGIVCTFCLCSFAQIWFDAPSLSAAGQHAAQLLSLMPSGSQTLASIPADVSIPMYVFAPLAFYVGAGSPGLATKIERLPSWVTYAASFLILSLFTTEKGSRFIYGQF